MADLMVGLSRSVVEGALSKVQTAIHQEAKLRQKTQRDLVLISLEFEMMRSSLKVANDDMITSKNDLVRTWVRHVRELAYDLEDCVEFVVHLDGKPIFWRRLLPSCIARSLPLDQAAVEIEDLKGKAKELSKCYMRYSHVTNSAGSKLVILQQQSSSRAAGVTAAKVLSKARDAGKTFGDLTQLITKKYNHDDLQLRVISIWGTHDDLGMTSVIRRAYNDPEICASFACRTWVKLMHPFNPHEFVRRFMAQVYANDCREQGADQVGGVHALTKMKAKQDHILRDFVQEVKSKTYLVVLDNLTDMVDWDAVRTFLPDMKNGSSIIVSTQKLEIASLCIGHSYQVLQLKHFCPDHSVCALFKENYQDNGHKEDKPMVCEVSLNSSMEKISSSDREAIEEWMESHPIVGCESQMNALRSCIVDMRYRRLPRIISVCGIAGIGKSFLVRNFYYDQMIHKNQFNKYSWVNVSRPFNLRDFSRSLLSDQHSAKDPIKECHELLSQHKCLVVIDDLRSREEWDLIQASLVSSNSPSVIIVISSEASVAKYCTHYNDDDINVKCLEAVAAMDLFRKEVRRNNPSSPLINHLLNSEEVEVHRKNPSTTSNDSLNVELEEVILKCGGLPEMIVSIAALLAPRSVTLMDTIRSLNNRFLHYLEINPEYGCLRSLFDRMYNYFNACPDSLKPCIFYLSIFPRFHNIRQRRLVRRWIAEGYSRDSEEESAVEKGERYLSKLLDLSIIQEIPQLVTPAFSGTRMRTVSCQVNSFIHEYIVCRIMEENLVVELGPNCVLNTQSTGRHLRILKTWDIDRNVFESIDFSRLWSLTVFGKWEPFFISKSMRLLRVLDLEDALGVKDEDIKTMVQRLLRLKFLSLRGCSEIFCLPNSLGDLRQLQTLDVRHTSIVTLPANITKLHKLQYIRAGTKVPTSTPSASSSRLPEFHGRNGVVGVKVPRGIGKLMVLHTLGVVNVSASGGKAVVEEIKMLTQLRKLGVSGINKHNCMEFFFATSGLVHLESLLVQLDKDSQGCLDGISLPWENLDSLKLYGLQEKLPLSRSHLQKLRKLDLEMTTLVKSDIEFLANLPNLCILRLRMKQLEDDKLHFYVSLCGIELNSFKSMKILDIACSSGQSLNVTFGSESMKDLELLKVDYSSASYHFNGLNYLFELKQVLLKGADEEIKTALEKQLLENHPERTPSVKLEELPHSS